MNEGQPKERVIVLIDGFNLYHAIRNTFRHERYKWCDLLKLAENLIDKEKEVVKAVYYFTAYCTWNKEKRLRHKLYVRALSESERNIRCILGTYRRIHRNFERKKMGVEVCLPWFSKYFLPRFLKFRTYEEKETDVNIAVKIIELAFLDRYDHVYILSGDSDLAGAVKFVKEYFPEKKIHLCLADQEQRKDFEQSLRKK